jgi:hypothetical protein
MAPSPPKFKIRPETPGGFKKNRAYKPYLVVLSPPAIVGPEFVPLKTRRTRLIKQGESFTIGKGAEAEIKLPFHNVEPFQQNVHGRVFVDDGGRLKYADLSDIGSVVIRFMDPLRKRHLRQISEMPGVAGLAHISKGGEVDLTDGRSAIGFGVHKATVDNGNINFVDAKAADGKTYRVVRDEHPFGHVRPMLLVPLSGRRRFAEEDPYKSLANVAEDWISNLQGRYARKFNLARATTTDPAELGKVVGKEEVRRVDLSTKFLEKRINPEELKELFEMYGMRPPVNGV